jgi:hypothetical protein
VSIHSTRPASAPSHFDRCGREQDVKVTAWRHIRMAYKMWMWVHMARI